MLDTIRDKMRRRRQRQAVSRAASGSGPLVLVYQMGKVGSSSVQAALKALEGLNSFQVHRLEKGFLDAAVADCQKKGQPIHRRLEQSLLLREQIIKPRRPAKVISLVREPIGRNISAYFENLDRLWDIKNAHESLTMDQLQAGFFEKFSQSSALTWFDDEFNNVLGIDIYQKPFPHAERFVRIDSPPYEALIMRVDLDDERKVKCIEELLGIKNLPWASTNSSDDTVYGDVYREFKKAVRLPREYIDTMLDSKFSRHFFSPAEIAGFREKWMRHVK